MPKDVGPDEPLDDYGYPADTPGGFRTWKGHRLSRRGYERHQKHVATLAGHGIASLPPYQELLRADEPLESVKSFTARLLEAGKIDNLEKFAKDKAIAKLDTFTKAYIDALLFSHTLPHVPHGTVDDFGDRADGDHCGVQKISGR